MSASSFSWGVVKSGAKIVATNRMTKRTFTVFADSEEEGTVEGGNRAFESGTSYEVVSLVGPVLSVCESWYSDSGAHPSYGSRFRTVNLDRGKEELSLTDIFDESEVLTALLKDRIIGKHLGKVTPKRLADLEALDGGCEIDFQGLNRSFAFHHLKGGAVAVRIGLPHGCEVMRGNFTQLGIYLPLSRPAIGYFRHAEKNKTLMRYLWREAAK
ncbi:hypothetical protein L4X63_00710 [Geomonas sp. Red32]|uniref:hypothetical protein n=1 Tax=Geomonas sp. Red32 TaxID=2912856 RepID=UPI00202CB364|nr:hypothetical protein [Geomonas sp. Red32]MCM0080104.1 hypothetical protein [Geomonas sp. Red32]